MSMYLIKTHQGTIEDLEGKVTYMFYESLLLDDGGETDQSLKIALWEKCVEIAETSSLSLVDISIEIATGLKASRIWQHLESLCKFDATKEVAPKPEPTAHKYAPLDNPQVGEIVYFTDDLSNPDPEHPVELYTITSILPDGWVMVRTKAEDSFDTHISGLTRIPF